MKILSRRPPIKRKATTGLMFTHDDEPSTNIVVRDDGVDDIANMSILVIFHLGVGDLLPGKVGCQSEDRMIAAPEVGVLLAGVTGGSDPVGGQA